MCVCNRERERESQGWLRSDTLVLYDISSGFLAFLNDGTFWRLLLKSCITSFLKNFAVCLSGRISIFLLVSCPLSSSVSRALLTPYSYPSFSPLLLWFIPRFFSSARPSVDPSVWCCLLQLLCPSRTINPSRQPVPGPRTANTYSHMQTHASQTRGHLSTHALNVSIFPECTNYLITNSQ